MRIGKPSSVFRTTDTGHYDKQAPGAPFRGPWVIQQLREAFPQESDPRFLIHDNDSIFSERVSESIRNIGIEPQRTAFRSPWQNGIAERWVGRARQEMLDHVIVMNAPHLHRLLREYVDHYNTDRVHTQLRDSRIGRPTEHRPARGRFLPGGTLVVRNVDIGGGEKAA